MSLIFNYVLTSIMGLFHCFSVQEDSEKTGKVTSSGLYFLHFQVYRMDSTVNAVLQVQIICSLLMFPILLTRKVFISYFLATFRFDG